MMIAAFIACLPILHPTDQDAPDVRPTKDGALDDTGHEGGKLSIDDVEEGEEEGRLVRSFEIQGMQVG